MVEQDESKPASSAYCQPIIVPDQEHLDSLGYEYVGFREPRHGEFFITKTLIVSFCDEDSEIDANWHDGQRWILKTKAKRTNTNEHD